MRLITTHHRISACLFVFAFALLGAGKALASVSITAATGGSSISADTAATAVSPAWTTLGAITIAEGARWDFAAGNKVTLILKAPAGFQFNTGVTPDIAFTAGRDIASAALAMTDAATITVTLTVGHTYFLDTLRIGSTTRIQVQPIAGGPLATGRHVYRPSSGGGSATITGITTSVDGSSGSNFGTLTEVVGAFARLQLLMPGETAVPGTPTGTSGTPTAQTAGTAFNATVRAVDAAWNLINTNDTVHITSSDGQAILPTNAALSAGSGTFSVTFRTSGSQTASASDVTHAGIGSDTGGLTPVNPAAASKLVIAAQPSATATAGVAFAQQPVVFIEDAFNNIRSNDTLVVTATRSGGAGNLLGTTNLTAVAGVVTFTDLAHPYATNVTIRFSSGALAAATSGTIVVSPANYSQLVVLLPGQTSAPATVTGKTGTAMAQTAGAAFSVRVSAVDAYWNLINTNTDLAGITSSDTTAVLPGNATLVNGTNSFTLTFKDAGSQTVTANDLTDGHTTGVSSAVTVNAGAAAKLQLLMPGEVAAPGTSNGKIGTPSAQTAGTSFILTVNAVDANWNVASSTHTVEITTTDPNDVLPVNAALVAGTRTFTMTNKMAGSWTATATDTTAPLLTANTSPSYTVNPGAFAKLQLLMPGETAVAGSTTGKTGTPTARKAGTPCTVTVNAVDANWNLINTNDTVYITSSDTNAALPGLGALVSGSRTFSVTFNTAGSRTVTATNVTNAGITANTGAATTVDANGFAKLQLLMPGESAVPGTLTGKTGTPTARVAGTAFNITVNAVDANWNLVSTNDTVAITSSDPYATLPANTALSGGTWPFSVTCKTAGIRTVTASDVTHPDVTASTGASATVNSDGFVKLQLLVPGETAAPGSTAGKTGTPYAERATSAFNVTVNGVDANWNIVNTNDTIRILSSDTSAVLPANAPLIAGTRTFSVTLVTPGSSTITASNATHSAITLNSSSAITVNGMLAQTITFADLSGTTYGAAPLALSATASSGLPVTFSVLSGPATVSANTLTLTGAGTVTVRASQVGDSSYEPVSLDRSFTVSPAPLTVKADNTNRLHRVANPALTACYTGFVNGENPSVLSGVPSLTTTANASSPPGSYPIVAAAGTLSAANYSFVFVNGSLTVTASFTTNTFNFAYTNREALLADGWDFIARQPSFGVSGAIGFVDRNTETTNGLVVDFDQSAHPGALRIPVDVGDLWYNSNNSRNTLFRNLSNDWVSLRAQMSFRPTQTYQTASLLLYQDDNNFVAMVHDYNGSERAGFGFENDAFGLILASSNIAATNILLRLDRDLDTGNVSGFYSLDGTNWMLVGQFSQTLVNPRLAIFVGETGGSGNVDLSRVDIITSATNPAPVLRLSPQHLVFNAVAGQACTNLQRVNLVVRSQDDPVHWSTTNTAPWLSANPAAGDTPGFCNVAVDAAGLAAGIYEGAVQFGAPGAVSATVNVTLIVNPASGVQVATWGGGKGGAMSVSVDDSYPTAFDDLATNGFGGTYFENGNLAPAFFSSYYQAGMELGAHTLNHPCFVLNELAWRYELEHNLAGLCPGSLPCESVITFAYPCGEHNILEEFVTADYFLSARGYNLNQLEDATPNDFMNLKSFNSHNDAVLPPPVNDLKALVDATIAQGKWFNLVLHALNVDDGAIVYSVGKDIWVAPIGTITKYILQRDRTVITNYYAVAGQISFDCYRLPLDASIRRSFETAIGPQDTLTMQVDLTGMNAVSGLTVNGTPASYSFKTIGGKERMLFNLAVTGTPQTVVVQCVRSNTSPVLAAQTNRTISALSTLVVANAASDPDAPPQTLTYTLLNPPAGAQIDANGVIQWTPSTNQIPGPYMLTTVVTDNAQPPLSATNTFGVSVEPPGYFLLPAISDVTLNEGQTLAITNTAISTGVPNPQVATNSINFFYTNRDVLLADGWSYIATNPDGSPRDTEITDPTVGALASYDQTAHPGVLRIPADLGDLWGNYNNTRNSLFRNLATNWTSMKLWVSFAPTLDYQQTHIGIYQNDNNYLDIGLAHNTSLGGEVTTYVLETNGIPNHYYMGARSVTNIVLRMDQNAANGTVDGLYSVDGIHWTFMGTWPQPFTNPRLTVWTSSSFLPYTAGSANADMQRVDVVTSNLVVQVLTYRLIDAPAGATISTNGVIAWTPTAGQGGQTFVITTVATDNSVPPLSATNSFSVSVRGAVAITGTVAYYPTNYLSSGLSGKRVGSVTMSVTGDTNLSGFTLPDGSYSLTNIPVGGTYCVTPSKTNDSPTKNGVSAYDLGLIQAHILKRVPEHLDSPFKLLAADVSGDGRIDAFDLGLIQAFLLSRTNQFPAGLWRFVPIDFSLNMTNWTNAPSNRWYINVGTNVPDADFVAIKLGDVANAWTAPNGGNSVLAKSANGSKALVKVAAPEVVFAVSQQSAQPGETVTVGVTVSGFSQLTSAQFSLAWDPAVLRYVGTGSYGLKGLSAGSFGTTLVESGKLAFAWYDPAAVGVRLADGIVLFTVSFEAIGQVGSVSSVALAGAPTPQEVSVDFTLATFGAQDGSVAVVGPGLLATHSGYANGVFRLSVPTEKGHSYVLEFTDSLVPANWTALPAVLGDGTVNVLVDPVATNQQRFYRVYVQ